MASSSSISARTDGNDDNTPMLWSPSSDVGVAESMTKKKRKLKKKHKSKKKAEERKEEAATAMETTTAEHSVPTLGKKDSDDVVEDPNNLALKATQLLLDYYNRSIKGCQGRVYELVELVCSKTMPGHNVCVHVNFKAKKKNAPDRKAVNFFGELLGRPDNVAMRVCILQSGESVGSCDGCNPDLVHPPDNQLNWYASLRGKK